MTLYNAPSSEPYNITNLAAFRYLQTLLYYPELKLPEGNIPDKKTRALITHLRNVHNSLGEEYDKRIDYASLYTRLHELAEKIPQIKTTPEMTDRLLDHPLLEFKRQFFIKLYENNSHLYTDIDEKLIQGGDHTAQKAHIQTKLGSHQVKRPGFFQFTHPDNWANKLFSGLFGIDYNPLKRSNIPYVAFARTEDEKQNHIPTVLRMGTQVKGLQTLQPSFLNFLASKKSDEKPIHHIYFNLQKRDLIKKGFFERFFENRRTKTLENINNKNLGAAVITLPADNPHFLEGYDKKKGKSKSARIYQFDEIKDYLIDSIRNDKNDFYIPEILKAKLFENGLNRKVTEMLNNSFQTVFGKDGQNLNITAAQRQAVLFDFVKFQLSEAIIQSFNPDTVNFSCKDAIDRGGVHALWYEFRRRQESGEPMTKEEFNQHLDASALLVKGRPVNDHRNLIWNALNESFLNNPEQFKQSSWVKRWLIDNYPIDKKILKIQEKLAKTKNLNKEELKKLEKHDNKYNRYKIAIASTTTNSKKPETDLQAVLSSMLTQAEPAMLDPVLSNIEDKHDILNQYNVDVEPSMPLFVQHSKCNVRELKTKFQTSTVNTLDSQFDIQPSKYGMSAQVSLDENHDRVIRVEDDLDKGNLHYYIKKNLSESEFEATVRDAVILALSAADPSIKGDLLVDIDGPKRETVYQILTEEMDKHESRLIGPSHHHLFENTNTKNLRS